MRFFLRWLKAFAMLIGFAICFIGAILLFVLLMNAAPVVAIAAIVLVFLGIVAFSLVSEADDYDGW